MTGFILPGRFGAQPQTRAIPARQKFNAPTLLALNGGAGFPWRNTANSNVLTNTGSVVASVGPGGKGVTYTAGTYCYTDLAADISSILTSGTEATILIYFRKTDSTNRTGSLMGTAAVSAPSLMNLHAPYSDGTIYFDWAGGSVGSTRVTAASSTYTSLQIPNVLGLVVGGTVRQEIWQNGKKIASQSASGTRSGSTNWYLNNLGGAATPDSVEVYGVWAEPRAWTATELVQINPSTFASLWNAPYRISINSVAAGTTPYWAFVGNNSMIGVGVN